MNLFRTLILALCSMVLLMAAGCQTQVSENPGPSAASTVLRVGVSPMFAPMIFKQGREITGFEAEAARELGRELGRTVTFVEVNWDEQIESLLARKTDIIMSSMTITSERRMRVAFAQPYLKGGQMLLVRRTDLHRYSLGVPARLPGTVGMIKGTVGESFVQRELATSKHRTFDSVDEAVSALANGRIDAFVCDAPVVWYEAGASESRGLGVVPRCCRMKCLVGPCVLMTPHC